MLLEDDLLLGEGIKVGLNQKGFNVDWITDGKTGKVALFAAPYDAVVLDLTLRVGDTAWVACSETDRTGVNPDCSRRTNERVDGLRFGAGLSVQTLCATCLEALIRRTHGQTESLLTHGNFSLDPLSLVATAGGESLALKPKEFALS